MKRHTMALIISTVFLFPLWSCARDSEILPVHDEVLVYALPFDLVYLRTMEAIEKHPDWRLETTDKEMGIITLKNFRFSSFADADKRTATLLLKRVSKKETSVEFAPESRTVVGGDEILSVIKQYLSREVSLR